MISEIFLINFRNNDDEMRPTKVKCGENRNHGKFKIYFLRVEL